MPKIVNRAYMTTATTGTGTITLGSAVGSFRSFAASGVVDGDVVRYVIEDGVNWEIGSGTYAASGTTLTRTVEDSSSGGTAITLTGTAVVFVTAVAADLGGGDALGTVTGADLDLSTGNIFEVTADDQTLTFSNPPDVHAFSIKVTGAGSITYPASVTFESGSPPAAPAVGAVETIDLYTVNGGTNYYDAGYSSQSTKPVFQAWARNIVLDTTYTEITSWEDVFVNIGNHFDPTTGRFTAPVDGTYQFGVASLTNNVATVFRFRPYLDGVSLNNYELRIQPTTGVYFPNTEFCWYATMTSGQEMSVYALSSDGTDTYNSGIDFRYHYLRGQLVT